MDNSPDLEVFQRTSVSFTRRGGRLTERQQRAWDDMAGQYVLDLPRSDSNTSVDPDWRFDPVAAFGRDAPLIVEIGSGRGEAIVQAAAENPDTDFLALEVYIPGIAQTLVSMRHSGVDNVRIGLLNAAEALETSLAPASIEELWVFFPDPWHKLRHRKRRLVTDHFAGTAARVLKPGGIWRLATDWQNYADQMRDVLIASEDFDTPADWSPRFEGRVMTRFEQKGLDVDRAIRDLSAVRREPRTMTT